MVTIARYEWDNADLEPHDRDALRSLVEENSPDADHIKSVVSEDDMFIIRVEYE